MLNLERVEKHIVSWLKDYCEKSRLDGFVIGISGGIDSALTATLCAMTGKKVICLNMPIRQHKAEYERAVQQIDALKKRFEHVSSIELDLTETFETFEHTLPIDVRADKLSMANSRSRLRMMTLYSVGQANRLLVAGTGNKVEDFGIGFFTKYGDGGVDLSPIADLYKTDVFALAKHVGVIDTILTAKPTDGLWDDERNDEDQIGATYPELEWAMEFKGDASQLSNRQQEVIEIYNKFHRANKHKMIAIPFCEIPKELK